MADSPKNSLILDRALAASLFLLALAAPVSIAGTQIAWSFGLLFWILRALLVRPKFSKSGFDLAILAFVGLSILSSVFSYEPAVSMEKLVGVSLVTIVYLVAQNIREAKTVRWLTVILLASAAFSAVWVIGNFIVGKNMKVGRLAVDSPLRSAGVEDGDTVVSVNGRRVNVPEDLAGLVDFAQTDVAGLLVYRQDWFFELPLQVASIPEAPTAAERFGIVEFAPSRDLRATGFFNHYTTYAEAIQLILSITFALLVVLPGGLFSRNRLILAGVVGAFSIALFLTLTRGSWAGFAMSAALIVLIGASRRTVVICAVITVPLVLGGLVYLQQKRSVGFIDTKDNSTTWRMTVWREAVGVLASTPRHFAIGVGMDSIKTHWQDWRMFDNGYLPMGHMHSTPLQIAFERGIPALIAWIAWMYFYLRMLWRSLKSDAIDWLERGLLLGCFGGSAGFIASGLVHYNWGDSEVIMIFYLLMGLSIAVDRMIAERQ